MISSIGWAMILVMNGEPQFRKDTSVLPTEEMCQKAADMVNEKLLKNDYAVKNGAFYVCGEIVRPEVGENGSEDK